MKDFASRPTLQGSFGMVSSTHWIASQAAMGILEKGGNAYDAATCAGFVLHLVEPHLNGPGGEVPAVICHGGSQDVQVLCGQGVAPRVATPEFYAERGVERIPGAGPLASAVPGAVDAWLLLLRDHGTMSLREVLEPAIHYATVGAPMVGRVGETVASVADLFAHSWGASARQWLAQGRPPAPGEVVANRAYGRTLERLVRESEAGGGSREAQLDAARRAWREGFVAEAVDAFAATEVPWDSGSDRPIVDGQDMASWEASWEKPASLTFNGYEVHKTRPWGQGPALLQALGMVEGLSAGPLDPDTPDGAHTVIETIKLAMADREAWFGDAGEVSVEELLARDYLAERARLITEDCSLELRPGSPGGREPKIARAVFQEDSDLAVDGSVGEPTVQLNGETRGDTCHVDVVDRWGNMISATPSGGWLQSNPIIPELGFPLGSRMQMFWLEQGLPSSLAPGLRPRTTLTPTLVTRDGVPYMACGSPGGDQQDQWQFVFLLRTLGLGMDLQDAIDAPMYHTASFPGSFYPRRTDPGAVLIEDRLSGDVIGGLGRRGHRLLPQGPWSLGRLCAVTRDTETGAMYAAANPRGRQGYAVGR